MMYGAAAYSEVAYSEDRNRAQILFLDRVDVERSWLLELDVFPLAPLPVGDPSGAFAEAAFAEVAYSEGESESLATTLYYSDRGYISRIPDSPSATYFHARLRRDLRIERRIYGQRGVGGLTRVLGSCTLINRDGGLDTLLKNYAVSGRAVRLYVGAPEDAKINFVQVFAGVIEESPKITRQAVEIPLSDGAARLVRMLNETTYAGTGALEGGADLKGKYKPKCYGKAFNVSAPLVDSVKLIYQVNDGAIQDVPAVYDRGIALVKGADYASQGELETTAPAAGQYRVWKGGGFFRLGSTPAGTCTCDIEGDASPSYIDKTADIVKRILEVQLNLQPSDIDAGSIAELNTAAPAEVHSWSGTEGRRMDDAIDELLASVGAFGGFSRLGTFRVGIIALPTGTPAASYTEADISDIERLPLPAQVEPMIWRALVGYERNYTIQIDLAAAVPAARRSYAAQPMRVEESSDASIKSRARLARELGVPAIYRDQADALAEAVRLMDLWGDEARALFVVPLPLKALTRELNEIVSIQHSRHGLADGAKGRVLAHVIETNGADLEVLT